MRQAAGHNHIYPSTTYGLKMFALSTVRTLITRALASTHCHARHFRALAVLPSSQNNDPTHQTSLLGAAAAAAAASVACFAVRDNNYVQCTDGDHHELLSAATERNLLMLNGSTASTTAAAMAGSCGDNGFIAPSGMVTSAGAATVASTSFVGVHNVAMQRDVSISTHVSVPSKRKAESVSNNSQENKRIQYTYNQKLDYIKQRDGLQDIPDPPPQLNAWIKDRYKIQAVVDYGHGDWTKISKLVPERISSPSRLSSFSLHVNTCIIRIILDFQSFYFLIYESYKFRKAVTIASNIPNIVEFCCAFLTEGDL